MKLIAKNRKIFPVCMLLILFVGYVGNATLFYHTHIVGGEIITHSHPYSQTPDSEKHTHSTAQFASIASLSVLLMLATSVVSAFGLFALAASTQSALLYNFYQNRHVVFASLRGPPCC